MIELVVASAVNLARLPHILMTIWRYLRRVLLGVAEAAGASLSHWYVFKSFFNSFLSYLGTARKVLKLHQNSY